MTILEGNHRLERLESFQNWNLRAGIPPEWEKASVVQTGMAQLEGEIVIRRPVEEVFDFVADERNEPSFNERMFRADLVTPEPIGAGSRFLVASTMMRRTVEMTVEYTAFERPRLLGSTSHSVMQGGKGRPLVIVGTLAFEPVPEGTRMRWSWQVGTPGAMKLLTPLVVRMGQRQEQRVWGSLKRVLEAGEDSRP